jgi:hypothetical protein
VNGSRVQLPAGAERPLQVFVNGVEQVEGTDFELTGQDLVFSRELSPPERHTAKTYARLMFWGRYGSQHSVDVVYRSGGDTRVASALEIRPPVG